MKYRILGKTGYRVSEVGYGSWSLGADWGEVSEKDAVDTLNTAIDMGVNFIDTADVYGDGRSEKIIGQVLKSRNDKVYVAAKAGRRLNPHIASGYTKENLNKFVERSRQNLQIDTLDLLQLHCPPVDVYYKPEVFDALDEMVAKKKIANYGVSVEKVEEGIKSLQYAGISTVQIIFNIFRQRPAELFFDMAKAKHVGIIVRVPLASGLLSGKMTMHTKFVENDHRNYNRDGKAFDVGETFAGIPYKDGISAVEELKKIVGQNHPLSQFALKWILMYEAVSTVIPGGKNPKQVSSNIAVSEMNEIPEKVIYEVEKVYTSKIKPLVHERW